MISYANIDRIEGNFAVCEVELIPFEESNPEDFRTKNTVMINISLSEFPTDIGSAREGDVFVVRHDSEKVKTVLYKDEEEMKRRLGILKQIFN